MTLRNHGRIKRAGYSATALLSLALLVGGVSAANASTAHKPAAHAAAEAAQHRHAPDGAVGGVVSAVSPTSITLSSRAGTPITFVIDSATTVLNNGASSSVSSIAVGDRVLVIPTATSASTAAQILAGSPDGRDRGAPGNSDPAGHETYAPHLEGTVVSVSDSTIVVSDRDGFWRSIATTSSTTYLANGSAADRSRVTVGASVFALGTVDANHTSLDATTVGIGTPPQH